MNLIKAKQTLQYAMTKTMAMLTVIVNDNGSENTVCACMMHTHCLGPRLQATMTVLTLKMSAYCDLCKKHQFKNLEKRNTNESKIFF